MKYTPNLIKEIDIKVRLKQSDDQIINDLKRDGFSEFEIRQQIAYQKEKNKIGTIWFTKPFFGSLLTGFLISLSLQKIFTLGSFVFLVMASVFSGIILIGLGLIKQMQASDHNASTKYFIIKSLFNHYHDPRVEFSVHDKSKYDTGTILLLMGCLMIFGVPGLMAAFAGIK